MSKRKTKEDFIREARLIHGDKYDYSKVQYVNNREKVCIVCPEHGEFYQSPTKHLSGQGCPFCSSTKKGDADRFIAEAKKIHGNRYDYSKVVYVNNREKVCIICPEHGEFWQDPHNHLKGKGCPVCGKNKSKPQKYTTESFIQKATEIHEGKYDYSKTVYSGMDSKVNIICPIHGEFWQLPYLHINGAGCPECAHISGGLERRNNREVFITRAREIHGDKYDYSNVKYITAKHKVLISCPTHGEFWQTPDKHLQGCGCPKCVQPFSKSEVEILNFIKSIVGAENVVEHNRTVLKGKELDIFIPSLKIAVEYNGLYWHNKDKDYHFSKTIECEKQGIRLIQIFEDEYLQHKDIVMEKLRHLMGHASYEEKIMGRKCTVSKISMEIAKDFLSNNHIQGFAAGTIHLGAKYNDRLVAVMSFKKEGDEWELVRFASKSNILCQGVGGKMFSYFVKEYNPLQVKSFADRRWSIDGNNLYTKIGFEFDGYVPPDYKYYSPFDGTIRQHKFGFRKQTLHKKYGLPLEMTESEMTAKLGYAKIYDCGLIRYKWKKQD